jgi:hypothetical protein
LKEDGLRLLGECLADGIKTYFSKIGALSWTGRKSKW